MKNQFSKSWKSSKQPRKQRKYIAKAPLHIKQKLISVNLSKELRKKHEKRNLPVRSGDVVKIMRGKFKKKQGKVTKVELKKQRIIIDGIQRKKMDGSKANVPIKSSNLQIVELNLDDKKRIKSLNRRKNIKEHSNEKINKTKGKNAPPKKTKSA